jgi:ABC-type enterochelin transport system substrate-binding protein
MQKAPTIFIAFLAALCFTACPSNDNKNVNNTANNRTANAVNANAGANSVKDDIEELEMIVKLPVIPEEAVWREENLAKPGDDSVPAPTDKKLVAVLRFLKDDAERVAAQAGKLRPATPETINTEKWFPNELIAQSQMSGDETLKGLSYAANDYYNMPYTDGKLTRIEGTDYFVLELFAK